MDTSLINEFRIVDAFFRDTGKAVSVFRSARRIEDLKSWCQAFEIISLIADHGGAIITGGGPGSMRAANAGAKSVGGKSVGANIVLQFEPLNTIHQDVSIVFNEFFTRKMVLLEHSEAFVCLPGGVGTLDEMIEILTLVKTERMRARPIISICRSLWSGLLEWLHDNLIGKDLIGESDFDDISPFDGVEEAANVLLETLATNAPVQGEALPT